MIDTLKRATIEAIKRIFAFVEFLEPTLIRAMDGFGLGLRFSLPYLGCAVLLVDALVPVDGHRVIELWWKADSLVELFHSIDQAHIGDAWLTRVYVLFVCAFFVVGWPSGERVRRSMSEGTEMAYHAGLLSDRLPVAIVPLPFAAILGWIVSLNS